MSKEKQVDELINSLKKHMNDGIQKQNYEKAMATIAYGCNLLYQFNQKYMDSEFENGVVRIAADYQKKYADVMKHYKSDSNTVLFYDGFGMDIRGVSKVNMNAIAKNGYRLIYVLPETSRGRMPETEKMMEGMNVIWEYIDMKKSYTKWLEETLAVIFKYAPKAMFYYTTPYDSPGAVAFAAMEGKADRFLIDLQDHAFWLGVKCNDYFCGSRQVSASNLLYERGARKEQLLRHGGSVLIDKTEYDHSGLPFDPENTKFIFSGGSLYKTLGDPELYYYKIVRHILKTHDDVYFLYAGDGDTSEMLKITSEFSDRAFLIKERKDFYYLITKCVFYLNTYPMFGGMMMKYSAYAGKLPVTLRHGDDSNWLLYEQDKRKIEYDTYEELITDVDRLLTDEDYLREREALLEGSVVSEEQFIKDMRSAIETHTVTYHHTDYRIDTTMFRKEFYDRFDFHKVRKEIVSLRDRSLFGSYPWMVTALLEKYSKKAIRKVFK